MKDKKMKKDYPSKKFTYNTQEDEKTLGKGTQKNGRVVDIDYL